MARGVQVSCRRLLYEFHHAVLPVPIQGFGSYLQHGFYPDSGDQLRARHLPFRILLDLLLPRLRANLEEPFEQVSFHDKCEKVQPARTNRRNRQAT